MNPALKIDATTRVQNVSTPINSDEIHLKLSQINNKLENPNQSVASGSDANKVNKIEVPSSENKARATLRESTRNWWGKLKAWLSDCAAISPSGSLSRRGRVGVTKLFLGLVGFAVAVALSPIFVATAVIGIGTALVGGAIGFVGDLAGSDKMRKVGLAVGVAGVLTALGPAAAFGFGAVTFVAGLLTLFSAARDALCGKPASPEAASNPA
ncbi:hypothetical protein [Hydrogenophaga sp. ANAO-22]|uniref:hypothetical protein n=1 Tax=Hydrogenophaga sp. ANAO-22 TaxID=3166645 RepID=UPI0036D2ACFB